MEIHEVVVAEGAEDEARSDLIVAADANPAEPAAAATDTGLGQLDEPRKGFSEVVLIPQAVADAAGHPAAGPAGGRGYRHGRSLHGKIGRTGRADPSEGNSCRRCEKKLFHRIPL